MTDNNWVKESFEKFATREIPEEVGAYTVSEKMVLVDMFAIDPPVKSSLIGLDKMSKEDRGFRWSSIGRVLASGSPNYEVGDLIKVQDYKVAIFENPKYGEWESFAPKGNVTKIGEVPPKYVTNFYNSFMRFIFLLSPVLEKKDDFRLFMIPDFEIIAKIKDYKLLIKEKE